MPDTPPVESSADEWSPEEQSALTRKLRRNQRIAMLSFFGALAGAVATAYLYYPADEFHLGIAVLVGFIAFLGLLPIMFITIAIIVSMALTVGRKHN